jgi:hypothetical protein
VDLVLPFLKIQNEITSKVIQSLFFNSQIENEMKMSREQPSVKKYLVSCSENLSYSSEN